MAYITTKYTFDDKPFRELVSRVLKASATSLNVGIVGAEANREHPGTNITMGEVALINEYGTDNGHIPPRRFMRETFEKSARALGNSLGIAMRRVIELRHSAESALAMVGAHAVRAIQSTIDGYVGPANAPSTVDRKGFDHPLIDTRELRNAMSFELVRESGNVEAGGVGEYEEFSTGIAED